MIQRRARKALLIALALAVTAFAVFRLREVSWASTETPHLYWIAHALGGIDGHTYTNSSEAFAINYARGFHTFEVDLMLTADDQVCAFHSLGSMQREFGDARRIAQIDANDFMTRRYFGTLHPVCLDELIRIAKAHADARFVLDIKDSGNTRQEQDLEPSPAVYARIYQKLKQAGWPFDQTIPQIYSQADLGSIGSIYDFRAVIYTLYRSHDSDSAVLGFVQRSPAVVAVAVDRPRFTDGLARGVREMGRGLYVYTVNDASEITSFSARGATGFYTDFHDPTR